MIDNRMHFPIPVLIRDGQAIVAAAGAHNELTPRLPAGALAQTRALLAQVTAGAGAQKGKRADVGTLTTAQNTGLKALRVWIGKARNTAFLAFRGQDVKLHEEFQVGVNEPHDLGSVVLRADIILAALQKPANLPALKSKGWLEADTQAFAAVRATLGATDETQEKGKGAAKDATGQVQRAAYDLYEALLAMQNAADLQWPAENPAHAGVRDECRLSTFPPRGGGHVANPETPPPAPTPPAK